MGELHGKHGFSGKFRNIAVEFKRLSTDFFQGGLILKSIRRQFRETILLLGLQSNSFTVRIIQGLFEFTARGPLADSACSRGFYNFFT